MKDEPLFSHRKLHQQIGLLRPWQLPLLRDAILIHKVIKLDDFDAVTLDIKPEPQSQ